MTGLSNNDFSFFENKSSSLKNAAADGSGSGAKTTSPGQSPSVKNSDLLIGLFSAPAASIPDISTTSTTNSLTKMIGNMSIGMAGGVSNNSSTYNSFSNAKAGVSSSAGSATATGVDNDDDDDFGDFVDCSSSNEPLSSVSAASTNSSIGSQQTPIFASFPPIASSSMSHKDTQIIHSTINDSHDNVPAAAFSDPLSPQNEKPNLSDHVADFQGQPSSLMQEMPHGLTSSSASTTQNKSSGNGKTISHTDDNKQQPQSSNVPNSSIHESFNDLTSSIPQPNSLITIPDVSPIILTAPVSENSGLEEKKSDDIETKEPSPFDSVPPSTELIALFNDNVLHFVDQLFEKLVPLPYALKKRVLANIGTKKFLDGYLATIQVGVMILEGRYRRLHHDLSSKTPRADTHSDPGSERAAREFVRVWTAEIVPRLRTAGLRPVELSRVPAGVAAVPREPEAPPTCAVCGLARDERPSVYFRPCGMRWEEKPSTGHLNCLRFWAHRDVYGITV